MPPTLPLGRRGHRCFLSPVGFVGQEAVFVLLSAENRKASLEGDGSKLAQKFERASVSCLTVSPVRLGWTVQAALSCSSEKCPVSFSHRLEGRFQREDGVIWE